MHVYFKHGAIAMHTNFKWKILVRCSRIARYIKRDITSDVMLYNDKASEQKVNAFEDWLVFNVE